MDEFYLKNLPQNYETKEYSRFNFIVLWDKGIPSFANKLIDSKNYTIINFTVLWEPTAITFQQTL